MISRKGLLNWKVFLLKCNVVDTQASPRCIFDKQQYLSKHCLYVKLLSSNSVSVTSSCHLTGLNSNKDNNCPDSWQMTGAPLETGVQQWWAEAIARTIWHFISHKMSSKMGQETLKGLLQHLKRWIFYVLVKSVHKK